jgi:cytochrome c
MSIFDYRIPGALLLAILVVVVIGKIGNNLVSAPHHVAEATALRSAAPAAAAPIEPVSPLIASASVENGQNVAKKCAACHTFDKGGKNGVGPNLYAVINARRGHIQGFAFSNQFKAKEGSWTYESLNAWLANPKQFIPGNKMAFAGLPKASERADVIAFLRSRADQPAALPTPAEIDKAKADAAAAAEAAKAAAATPAPARAAAPAAPKPAAAGAQTAKAAPVALPPVAPLLAAANLDNGKAKFRLCAACHTPTEGGKNLVGPNLWNIVNRPRAASEGFSYSPGLKAMGGAWSYEDLNGFIANPKQYLPQTKMAFAGVPKPEDRADVIAYLRTLSATPAPLP